ncbi:hypothetical protein GCM10022254_53730 [Actinomadura meridiana]|uniref:Alpha/beta hydrolase n=1 Tax=Actinomadura meridiana TaxID=559626 RepID=A0ABP8CEK1_9ACTN
MALAVAAVTCTAAGMTTATTQAATTRPTAVGTVAYDLGDSAFRPPAKIGYEGANELAGTVYYPRDLEHGRHPLIVIEHGSWQTCADRKATDANAAAQRALEEAQRKGDTAEEERQEKILEKTGALIWRWPCAGRTPPLPSLNGYAYLGRKLAERGFVIVSIGTNGINATAEGQADTVYYARAALINAHLAMWQRLSSSGTGPLRGKFTDPRTHRPRDVGFAGHVDLSNVGTIGHSMGGGGVMQQVADQRRSEWPTGVTVRAAFALAPTDNWNEEIVTKVPFAVMWGTCDQVNTGHYFEDSAGHNRAPIYRYTLAGGNHDNYNTEWSPSGGQVGSKDDALPGTRPGTCRTQFPDGPQTDDRELTETRQRAITTTYVLAFFQRHLHGRKDFDAILTGRRHPKDVTPQYEVAHAS